MGRKGRTKTTVAEAVLKAAILWERAPPSTGRLRCTCDDCFRLRTTTRALVKAIKERQGME